MNTKFNQNQIPVINLAGTGVSGLLPINYINIGLATTSTTGLLSDTDWNTFNNKGTFTLPSLTAGSVLFSNGSTIAQDNVNFFWDDSNNRLGIGTAAPATSLHVLGAYPQFRIASSGGDVGISMLSGATFVGGFAFDNGSTVTSFYGPITGNGAVNINGSDLISIGAFAPITGVKVAVRSTGEQLRLGYDGSNYVSFTVSSGGDLTVAPTGGDTAITGNLGITGTVTGSNLSGTNTGDQIITLTGDVSGSGTGSFTTTIAASTILAKTLTGYASGTSISPITSSDTILQGLQKVESDFNSRITYAGNSTYLVYVHDCDNNSCLTTSASTVSYSAGTAGHPGTITMTSPATQYNQARFNWGQNVQVMPFWIDDFQRITWVFKYDSVTDTQGWFGIYGTTGGPTSDQNQNYSILMYVSNTTITFQANTTSTSSLSCATACAANTWFKCDIIRNSATSVSLWINDTLQNTFTTNVPSGQACGVGGRLMTLANPGAKTWTMDYLEMIWTPTTARY